ncbi:MAG: ABC1 kinase family protein [Isosphaeraceae bacterium]
MIRETVGHLRDLPRYRQILTTLVRYGYQDVVSALHLEGLVRPIERVALGDGVPPHDRAQRLRLVFEDLGPTFVKLGQLLSTRPDLLPESYINELAGLRDDVRPFSFDQVEQIMKEEFGRPSSEVFASVDPVPVASASISQVHRAVLWDGRTVALKVRRPDIVKVVQADMDIIKNLAHLMERRLPMVAPYRPISLAREFERTLKRELDFSAERRNMQRCRIQFADDPTAHIPLVFEEFSTSRVIAMEFIDGVAIDDLEGIHALGAEPAAVAVTGARILLKQIFDLGFFHADPHPGNLRVLPGGVIAPLDYGMFGRLDGKTRERIADLLIGLLSQDTDRVLHALEALDVRGESLAPKEYRRDLGELVASYSELTLDTIELGPLLRDLIGFVRMYHLHIPPALVLLVRALVTIEGVGRRLDPHFDIARQLEPYLRTLAARRFHPYRLMRQTIRTTEDLQRIATLLPDLLSQSLESIKRGEMRVHFDLQGFGRLVRQLTRASNTLAVSLVISGLFIASALVLGSGPAPLAYAGFVSGAILCVWLFWNISAGH